MKITVITVCYNSVKTIEKTIQSVISQKYNDLEYIIIDGGSTDGTLEIIKKYQESISLWISEPDNGIYDAMNKGIKRATGEVIAFLNSDDWYVSDINVLQKVEKYFYNNTADILSGNIYIYICNEMRCEKLTRSKMLNENIFFENVCPHPAMFVRREVYEKIGKFDTSYKIAADMKWVIDAYMNGFAILCVEDCFTCFRNSGVSSVKPYASLKELYKVALECARKYHLTEQEKIIKQYYTTELKGMRDNRYLDLVMEERSEEVRQLFDCHKKYYIWGTGIRGKRCLSIFERVSIPVEGFIDSFQEQKKIGFYKVIRPEEIDSEIYICITPKNYEEELCEQLTNMGIQKSHFFTYSEMIKRIEAIKIPESQDI